MHGSIAERTGHMPGRRVYIPKAGRPTTPVSGCCFGDKIVQRADDRTAECIYEEDFLGFQLRVPPGRGTHDALDALCVGSKAGR